MPYIKQNFRLKYDRYLNEILDHKNGIPTKGELEYCIFKLMRIYMKDKQYRYSTIHDCVYAAMHCADEFRRRYLDKREDEAKEENGDI